MRLVDSLFGEDYGIVGEETTYKDINGKTICVGDVVKVIVNIYDEKVMVIEPMVKNIVDSTKKAYIMGIESLCDDLTGEINGETPDIKILVPYSELKEGIYVGSDSELKVESFENKEEK